MTIFQIDEFVICEYAAWDGDFTPPTSEWSPDARQLSPTNSLIELPLYIRPGIGDGSNGRGSGIVIPSPENAIIMFTVFIQRSINVVVSSPENAVIMFTVFIQRSINVVVSSPENAEFKLEQFVKPNIEITISSPENAILQLPVTTQTNSDIVIPSPENAEFKLEQFVKPNIEITISSPENAILQLPVTTQTNSDIVIPSPENAILQLGSSFSINTDLDESMIGVLPSCILKLIQNEIKLPIIFNAESERFIDLNISFESNAEILINSLLCVSRIYTLTFVNALELGIQFDFVNGLNFDFQTSFSFKNSLTSKVSLSYSFMNRMLVVNEVEKNFTFFNRILTDDPTIPSPQEYSGFYFSEIHGV